MKLINALDILNNNCICKISWCVWLYTLEGNHPRVSPIHPVTRNPPKVSVPMSSPLLYTTPHTFCFSQDDVRGSFFFRSGTTKGAHGTQFKGRSYEYLAGLAEWQDFFFGNVQNNLFWFVEFSRFVCFEENLWKDVTLSGFASLVKGWLRCRISRIIHAAC